MAAPMENMHAALGKLVFEISNFKNPRSKHRSVILQHYFNHAVSLVLPSTDTVSSSINELCLMEKSFLLTQLPLCEVMEEDLIHAFVKPGRLHMLTHKCRIDQDDCIAVLPTGHLIMHLTKDTYECLGLEGIISQFPRKSSLKHVVDIDLLDSLFVPGKKKYERVKRCLKQLDLKFDFICNWMPDDDAVCSSSIQKYFRMKGHQCRPARVASHKNICNNVSLPKLDPLLESTESYDHSDVFDWLGAITNGTGLMGASDEYINTYRFPGPTSDTQQCVCVKYTGMFSPSTVHQMLDQTRLYLKSSGSPWCSISVHGFADSPVSWSRNEHGYTHSGDNMYTFVVFPNEQYWCYKAISQHDVII